MQDRGDKTADDKISQDHFELWIMQKKSKNQNAELELGQERDLLYF